MNIVTPPSGDSVLCQFSWMKSSGICCLDRERGRFLQNGLDAAISLPLTVLLVSSLSIWSAMVPRISSAPNEFKQLAGERACIDEREKGRVTARVSLSQGRKCRCTRPQGVVRRAGAAYRDVLRGGEPLPTVSRYIRFYWGLQAPHKFVNQ